MRKVEDTRYNRRRWASRVPAVGFHGSRKRVGVLCATYLLAVLTLVSCERPRVGGTVVIAVSSDAGALLPVIEQSSLDGEVNNLMYLGLNSAVWADGALEYMIDDLSLAQSWEFGPDSTTLTYRLRPEAVWSDGEPISSKDVVFTYELIRKPEIASPRIEFWENLDSVVAVDESQVTFFFRRRYPGMLFHTGVGIIPAHIFEGHDSDNATLAGHPTLTEPGGKIVVSGPFQVAEWRRGDRLVLVPNPRAFASPSNLERVVFRIIPEETTRLIELRNGDVDVLNPAPVSAAEDLATDPRFRIETVARRFYDYIGWNPVEFEPFASAGVRRALSLAIDRETVLAGLEIAPYAEPAAGPYPPIFKKLADPTLQPDRYMPDSARAILAAEGWRDDDGDGVLEKDGRALRFTVLTQAGLERRTSAAEVIQAQYADVGIDMNIREVEFNALLDIMFAERGFEAVLLGWQVGLEANYIVGLFWPPDHVFNITGYANAALDSLITLAQSAATEDEAASYWRAAARTIGGDRPYAFLWYFDGLVAVNERVRNTNINTFGVYQNLHQWWVND